MARNAFMPSQDKETKIQDSGADVGHCTDSFGYLVQELLIIYQVG